MDIKLWKKRIELYAFFLSLLIAVGALGVNLYEFASTPTQDSDFSREKSFNPSAAQEPDFSREKSFNPSAAQEPDSSTAQEPDSSRASNVASQSKLDTIYFGVWALIIFLLFLFFFMWGRRLRAEKNKIWNQVPPSVWIATVAIICFLPIVVYPLFDSAGGLEQFSNVALAFAATIAAPFAIWRITLTSKQTNIQQQAEYRQSFLAFLGLFKDKDESVQMGAITQLTNLAQQDNNYRAQVIGLLLELWKRNLGKKSTRMLDFTFGMLAELDFNFCGQSLQGVGPSALKIHLPFTFGDAGTLLPKGVPRPKHWPEMTLGFERGLIEWKKWKANKKKYKPPKPPEE